MGGEVGMAGKVVVVQVLEPVIHRERNMYMRTDW
jgi:hypothetical protein